MKAKPRTNDEEYRDIFRKIDEEYRDIFRKLDEATKATNEEYQQTKKDVLTIRDRFALASVSYFLTFENNSYKEAIRLSYAFADTALEVRNESI